MLIQANVAERNPSAIGHQQSVVDTARLTRYLADEPTRFHVPDFDGVLVEVFTSDSLKR